jgi:hypothetical protein
MKNRDMKIKITELPLRNSHLSPDDTKNVFGGCAIGQERCRKDDDCCGYKSRYIHVECTRQKAFYTPVCTAHEK